MAFDGTAASVLATAIGHFPWFYTFNLLDEALPKAAPLSTSPDQMLPARWRGQHADDTAQSANQKLKRTATEGLEPLAAGSMDPASVQQPPYTSNLRDQLSVPPRLSVEYPCTVDPEDGMCTASIRREVVDPPTVEAQPTLASLQSPAPSSKAVVHNPVVHHSPSSSHGSVSGFTVARTAFIGFSASAVSEVVSNWCRLAKVVKQTSPSRVSYREALDRVIQQDGWWGVMFRGLKTRILAHGLQGVVFAVFWRGLEDGSVSAAMSAATSLTSMAPQHNVAAAEGVSCEDTAGSDPSFPPAL